MSKIIITPTYHPTHGCAFCPMLRRCKSERLWLDVLPCEAQLDFEVGVEFEKDSSRSLWSMPIVATVNIEAIG